MASFAFDSQIDSLLRQQPATDMTNANAIVSAADDALAKEEDEEKKKDLKKKLEDAQKARQELAKAIGDHQVAVAALERARLTAEASSRDEAKKLQLEKEAEIAASDAKDLLATLVKRLEEAQEFKDAEQELDKKKKEREAKEGPLAVEKTALDVSKTAKDNAEKLETDAQVALDAAGDADEATRTPLLAKLDAAKTAAKKARDAYDTQKKKFDAVQVELDRISIEEKELQEKLDTFNNNDNEVTITKHIEQLETKVTVARVDSDTLNKKLTDASANAKAARKTNTDNKAEVTTAKSTVTDKKTTWNEKLVVMEDLGTPEFRSNAATERLDTTTEIAKLQRSKQGLTQELPGILGLGSTDDIERDFNASQEELETKKGELDSAGITLQRYNRDAYFKMVRQRENIAAAEKSLESLTKEKSRLEYLQRRPELNKIALAANQSLLDFWEKMMTERQAASNDENREHAMRNAVMVQFRPQALKYLEKVQIDVLRIPVENSDYATGLVSGVRNTPDTNNGTVASGTSNPVRFHDDSAADPPSPEGIDPFVRDKYCIRHQQSLFETARRDFEKAKKEHSDLQSDQIHTDVEKEKAWDKLAAAEANMRTRYNDVQNAVSANELVTSLAKAAIGSLDTLEGALGKMRTVLMMRGSGVGAQERIDYLENVTGEIPSALGAYHAAYDALVAPANRIVDSDLLDERPMSQTLDNAGNDDRFRGSDIHGKLLLILRYVNRGKLGRGESATTNGWIDQVRGELATRRMELESFLKVVYAYNPEKSTTGAMAKIRAGDLTVFRFNVLRGMVTTTAYLLADDNVCHLFGKGFAKHFYAAQVTLMNPNKKPIIIYGNTMKLIVRMNSIDQNNIAENGRPRRLSWWALYQPLDHDAITRMMYTMHEQDGRMIASHGLDFMSMLGAVGSAFTSSIDYNRAVAVFSGMFAPEAKKLLEKDLLRYQQNFSEIGLNEIEEIAAGTAITRFVFLPKGPIYGNFDYDDDEASSLSGRSQDPSSKEFGTRALLPSYIHNIRREEVYIEGKRILASDPLSSGVR